MYGEEGTSAFVFVRVLMEIGDLGFGGGRKPENSTLPDGKRTRDTFEGGQRSHHYAIPAPQEYHKLALASQNGSVILVAPYLIS